MTDQGWRVDDGACLSCLYGQDWNCTNRTDDGWCCCGEDYQFELASTVEDDGL